MVSIYMKMRKQTKKLMELELYDNLYRMAQIDAVSTDCWNYLNFTVFYKLRDEWNESVRGQLVQELWGK